MKTIPEGSVITISAGENVVANRLIGFDGKYCAAGEKAFGVSEYDTNVGNDMAVRYKGIALITAGNTISVGAAIKATTGGKAIPATAMAVAVAVTPDVDVDITASGSLPTGETPVTSSSANPAVAVTANATVSATASATGTVSGSVPPEKINGYALDAATGDGDLIRVMLV